jgi:hypothetical protein
MRVVSLADRGPRAAQRGGRPRVAGQVNRGYRRKQHPLHQWRRPGKLDHVTKLPGEEGQLQEVWHSSPIDFVVLSQSEGIQDHGLESCGRTDLNAN